MCIHVNRNLHLSQERLFLFLNKVIFYNVIIKGVNPEFCLSIITMYKNNKLWTKVVTVVLRVWRLLFPASLKYGSIRHYLLAVALMALALWLRLTIAPVNAGLQYITFFPAVTLAAIAGGYRAGFFATLIGLAFATVIFTPPYYSFSWAVLQISFWSNMVFLLDGTILSISIEAMHRYRQRYEQELRDIKESEARELALNKELGESIAEHRRAAAALQESETRLRALFNTSAIGIVVIDEQGRIDEFNPASEAIFAYSQEEVIGQNINILMPEPYHGEHDTYIKNYLAGRSSNNIIGIEREVPGKRKGDAIFPMQLNVGEANLGNRRIFVGFVQDISTRKQTESTSRQFEAIVQSSDDAIMSKNLAGIVTSWNASAERMFGYTAEEMIGNSMLKLFSPDRVDEEKAILGKITQGQRVNHFETIRLRKDGSPIDVSVTLSPIVDEAGNVVGTSKIARDITKNKRVEQELYEAKQVAEAASRSKGEFLANMSHEIRTPMNAIIGLTRLATETEMTPKQQDYLQKIQTSSQALLGILNDILDLSKIESGRMDIERIEFDPTLMLQGVSDLFVAKAEDKGLEIFLDVAPEIPLTVVGDPLRIQQVLTNLLSNAVKFTPKGEIHVRMEIDEISDNDLLLRLSVRDTGIGINKAAIEHLFQPFSQADASTTRKFGGTGLGLTISKQMVELMGGSIKVSSQLGQGSIFSFTIRCGKGRPYNWNQDSHHLKGTRVLVVDDQETSCLILKNILESWGLHVTTVLSGEEAIQRIQKEEQIGTPFDLLLADWQMVGMSGLELAQELRREACQGNLKHPPTIIMVTAHSKELLLEEANSSSIHLNAILTKPVVPSSLLNTILHVYHYQGKEYQIPVTQIDPYEAARPLRNLRILLVEDNELNQQVAGEFLEKAGMRVSIANHGGEAVQWVKRENFDAVLMDLQMPEMDGYEATQRIRELPDCVNLPIIAMTAAAMQHDREACLESGMNDHVAKPIRPQELIDALLRWVNPTRHQCIPPTPPASREAWSDLADKLPGFELSDLMIMLSGNQKQLVRMLTVFRERYVDEAPAIAAQIAEGDMEAAKKRLHMFKGAAGNLGARDLHRASAALDAQLESGHYDATTLANWLRIFDRTMATLAELPAQQAIAAPPSVDGSTLQQVMAELDTLLAKDSFIDDELLERLKILLPNDKQAEYNTLSQYILDTDYPQARTVLNTLMGVVNGKN